MVLSSLVILVMVLMVGILALIPIVWCEYRVRKHNEYIHDGILYATINDEEERNRLRKKYPKETARLDEVWERNDRGE